MLRNAHLPGAAGALTLSSMVLHACQNTNNGFRHGAAVPVKQMIFKVSKKSLSIKALQSVCLNTLSMAAIERWASNDNQTTEE